MIHPCDLPNCICCASGVLWHSHASHEQFACPKPSGSVSRGGWFQFCLPWDRQHRSDEEKPGTCARAAPREHELMDRATVALAAPGKKRRATCAGRVPPGRRERSEISQAVAKANAVLAAVGKGKATEQTVDRKDAVAAKASLQKKRLSATGTRISEWRASTWVVGASASATFYEWNMWNMPADLILCCEVDVT